MTTCIVRGSGDIGSAVAHALFFARFRVAMHDSPAPAHAKRGRAFVDAFFDGEARLEGVVARHAAGMDVVERLLREGSVIPVVSLPFERLLESLGPWLLVDARMRKREIPERQVGLAPLSIGLGPNFAAGENADLVVETAWGDDLGKVIASGPSLAFTGEPRTIAGHGRARYIYAPTPGLFTALSALGSAVVRGDELATVGGIVIRAPLDGVLVGLTRSGVLVDAGAKIVEIDPRGDPQYAFRIGERARAIAAGVMRAVTLAAVARPGPTPPGGFAHSIAAADRRGPSQ